MSDLFVIHGHWGGGSLGPSSGTVKERVGVSGEFLFTTYHLPPLVKDTFTKYKENYPSTKTDVGKGYTIRLRANMFAGNC